MIIELVHSSCFASSSTYQATMIAGPAVARIARAPAAPPPTKAMPAKRARTMEITEFSDITGTFSEFFVDALVVQLLFGNWTNVWVGWCASL